MSFKTLIAVSTLAALPSVIGALPAAGQSTHEDVRQLYQTIAAGDQIRVRMAGGPTFVVQRPVMTDYGIEGIDKASGRTLTFPIGAVQQVWRRTRASEIGFKVGAVVGGLGGAAFGALMVLYAGSVGSPIPTGQGAAIVGVSGVGGCLIGGFAGAILAAPFGIWKTAYRVDQPRVRPLVSQSAVGISIAF